MVHMAEELDLSEGALSINSVVEGVPNFLDCNLFTGLGIDCRAVFARGPERSNVYVNKEKKSELVAWIWRKVPVQFFDLHDISLTIQIKKIDVSLKDLHED